MALRLMSLMTRSWRLQTSGRNHDLIIIDIRMPKINGFDLYRELKKRDGGIKVCFLTAFEIYYEEFKKMFPAIDVRAFIRKPVSISSLVSQVNSTIEST